MDTKFLTPIQLWKDFNPTKDALEISYILSETVNGYTRKGVYYTSENAEDGKARIYAEIVAPDDNKKKPVIIVVGDLKNNIDYKMLEYVSSCGYIAASCDYTALSNKEYPSKYPESLKHAEYYKASGALNRAEPSARESCWFVWSKANRRLLNVIANDPQADMNNVGVLGIKHGSLIMWQVAAMDGRIKAAASVIGNESMLYSGKCKYMPYNEELDESRVNWRAAISSEAYARFIMCPVLIASATNNSLSSFDRIDDIIKLMPDNTPYTLINNPRLSNQIRESSISSIRKWFNSILKKGSAFPNIPTLKITGDSNKALIEVVPDESKKIREVILYYSYGELDPAFRNWLCLELDKKDDVYSASIDVLGGDIRYFTFACITYQDNMVVSSIQSTFLPKDLNITSTTYVKQRIIYDTSKGIDTFTVKSDSLVLEDDNPHLEKSSMGINGLTATEGSLITYKIGDLRMGCEEDSILQLDAYCEKDAEIEIVLSVKDNGSITKYSACTEITGSVDWHKLSFECQDFKTEELFPLKSWQNLKKLEIKNAKGILFNNIIWV